MDIEHVALYRPIVGSAISHDGRWLAAVTPVFDRDTGSRRAVLQIRRTEGGSWRALHEGATSPVFAPDSRRLAALVDDASGAQVPAIFALEDGDTPLVPADPPDWPAAPKWLGRPGSLVCLGDDADGWRRVWCWGRVSAPPEALTPPQVHVGDYALSPDGRWLAWLRIPEPGDADGERMRIQLTDLEAGATVELPIPGRPMGYLSFSPDGTWLAYLARSRGRWLSAARLWIVDPARFPGQADAARCLTDGLEGTITGYDWLADSRRVVVAVAQGTFGRLVSTPIDGGEREVLEPRRTYLSGPHGDRSGGGFIHLEQHGDRPQVLRLRGADGAPGPVVLAPSDDLGAASLRPSETVTWSATDGTTLDGVLLRPSARGPAPLLVWIHGGPAEHVGQTFSPYFQAFAAAGFAVFAPNYRGSTGRDEPFLRANVGDLGGGDLGDVQSGIDRLVQMKVAHPQQLGLVGWSYGGTLALLLAERSSMVSAVVAGAPVVDWVSFFGARRFPTLYREYFPRPLWEDRAPLDRASPITAVRDLDAPTLVLHGAGDPLVPPSQSRLLYRVLKARGVPTDLMVYPDEGHVPSSPAAVDDMLGRIVRWLKGHMAMGPGGRTLH